LHQPVGGAAGAVGSSRIRRRVYNPQASSADKDLRPPKMDELRDLQNQTLALEEAVVVEYGENGEIVKPFTNPRSREESRGSSSQRSSGSPSLQEEELQLLHVKKAKKGRKKSKKTADRGDRDRSRSRKETRRNRNNGDDRSDRG
ncbi:unnamed protein product, partial [Amoebophrya sp. A25]